MRTELITSINQVIPVKGSNAGKVMIVINGKYWSKNEPKINDTHVCLEEVSGKTKAGADATFINVTGFTTDLRMPIEAKIKVLTSHDAAYSVGIATLLK